MNCEIEKLDNGIRYTYTLDGQLFIRFLVLPTGYISGILCKGKPPEDFWIEALKDVSLKICETNVTPQLNIGKRIYFLKEIAKKCCYTELPCQGVSFSVWKYQPEKALD